MKLAITDARAAELAALDEAATPRPWTMADSSKAIYGVGDEVQTGLVCDVLGRANRSAIVESRNALPDFLADRRLLLDALRRAVARCYPCAGKGTLAADFDLDREPGEPASTCGSCVDLRALLASAETDVRDLDAIR